MVFLSLLHITGTIFLLLLVETQGFWGNNQRNLDRTIQMLENRINASEKAYMQVIEANHRKSESEISAFKEYAVNLTSELKADFANVKADIAKVNADIAKVDEKLDDLNVFKIQSGLGWAIIISFLSIVSAYVVPFYAKQWGWLP
jgi:uncharacterized membrane protein YvbJ